MRTTLSRMRLFTRLFFLLAVMKVEMRTIGRSIGLIRIENEIERCDYKAVLSGLFRGVDNVS